MRWLISNGSDLGLADIKIIQISERECVPTSSRHSTHLISLPSKEALKSVRFTSSHPYLTRHLPISRSLSHAISQTREGRRTRTICNSIPPNGRGKEERAHGFYCPTSPKIDSEASRLARRSRSSTSSPASNERDRRRVRLRYDKILFNLNNVCSSVFFSCVLIEYGC